MSIIVKECRENMGEDGYIRKFCYVGEDECLLDAL